MSIFSETLKRLRKEKKITQIDFAKRFNISNGTIAKWETGDREPDFETVIKLADYFNVSIDELLGNEEKNKLKQKAFQEGLKNLNLDMYKTLAEEDKQLISEQFNTLIDRLQKK